jgi:hypothetical protein
MVSRQFALAQQPGLRHLTDTAHRPYSTVSGQRRKSAADLGLL